MTNQTMALARMRLTRVRTRSQPCRWPQGTGSVCDSHHAQDDEDDEYNDEHEPDVVDVHSVIST
jgi:hypothetical protein